MWIITNQKQQKLLRAESSCVKCVNGSPTRRAILQLSLGSVVYVNLSFLTYTVLNPIQSNPIFIVKTQLTERSGITDKHRENHQWRRYTSAHQVKWPGLKSRRPGSALAIVLLQ